MKKAVAVAAVWALCAPSPAVSSSWPAFRRDGARRAYVREQTAPPLTARWTAAVGGEVVTSPVVAYGRVYVGSRAGVLRCYDAYTGALLWSYTTGSWIDATPAVAESRIFVPGRDGDIHALDAATGTLLWRYATGATVLASPAVLNGQVYAALGNPKRKLLALDARRGTLRRSADTTQFTASSPVIDSEGGRVYLASSDGKYNAWDLSLRPAWTGPVQTRGGVYFATPALAAGKLVATPGDDDSKLHAWNPADGAAVWASAALSSESSQATSVAVSSSMAFLGSGSTPHYLYGLDLPTGAIRWRVALGAVGDQGLASSPAVANDVVYVVSPRGELYALNAWTGATLARIQLSGPGYGSPAVANGWVYAATMDGRLHAFEAERAATISSPDQLLDSAADVLTIQGTVASPNFVAYSVDYGTGSSPTLWTSLYRGEEPVARGTLAQWNAGTEQDGVYTVRVKVEESAPSGLATEAQVSFALAQLKTATVDAATMTVVRMTDGTEVLAPPGALEDGDVLSVRKLFSGYSDAGVPAAARPTSIVREFTVSSSEHPRFSKPVTLKLPYDTITPSKADALRLYYYDDSRAEWRIVNTSKVHKDERRVWAEVDHFTLFRIMEHVPSAIVLNETEVYTYPNPARGNLVTFKFRVGEDADVTIRVYDVAGDRVAELARAGCPGGLVSTIEWNITGKASGVYIYRLEARAAGGRKAEVTKKLAIVR